LLGNFPLPSLNVGESGPVMALTGNPTREVVSAVTRGVVVLRRSLAARLVAVELNSKRR
jgi:hypothetical protein